MIISTTEQKPWSVLSEVEGKGIELTVAEEMQKIRGFGTCFSELGACALDTLPKEEKKAFLAETGNDYTGLERVVREGMKLLNLCTYFTAGPEVEVRSWLIPVGCTAPQAAGKIHSDFEKGFIRADVYTFDDLAKYGDEKALREHGLIRSEGKEYIVKDGDVCLFKVNA